jgi:hypothetical protein
MASRPEVLGNRTIGRKKALGMTRGFKPLQASLPLAGRLVGIFRAVIEVHVLAVLHARQNLLLGCAIALQLVGNDHSRHVPAPFEELAEELLGRMLVPPALHQDIEHSPVLIHGLPEIMALPIDREKDFIEIPLVTRPRASASELIGIGLAEFPTPLPNGFIRDEDPTGEQQLLDIAIAEAE